MEVFVDQTEDEEQCAAAAAGRFRARSAVPFPSRAALAMFLCAFKVVMRVRDETLKQAGDLGKAFLASAKY
jgi:hypothetical protein